MSNHLFDFSGNTTVDELMMRLMGAMEIFTAQQQEDIKDEVQLKLNQDSAYSLPHNSLQLMFGGSWGFFVSCSFKIHRSK